MADDEATGMNVHQSTRVDERAPAERLIPDRADDTGTTPDPNLTFADLLALDAANRTITAEMIVIARGNMERAQAEVDHTAEPATWERRLKELFRTGD